MPILVDFDLADPKGGDAVQALTNQDGAPDGVVLNAGITHNALFALPPAREWDRPGSPRFAGPRD